MWKALSDLRAKYEMEKSPHLALSGISAYETEGAC
jgi:hypothetical protein